MKRAAILSLSLSSLIVGHGLLRSDAPGGAQSGFSHGRRRWDLPVRFQGLERREERAMVSGSCRCGTSGGCSVQRHPIAEIRIPL